MSRALPALCALLLSGCPEPLDPDAPPPTVEVGTVDHTGFKSIADLPGITVENGPQGGSHITLAFRTQHFDGRVLARYGVRDVATGQSLSQAGLQSTSELPPDGILIFPAFLVPGDPRNLVGRQVLLWADVRDNRHPFTHDERTTTVVEPPGPGDHP